jgi:hypothetical protein
LKSILPAGEPDRPIQIAADAERLGCFDRFRAVLGRRLVGDVLHELRNPLNSISLNTEMVAHMLAQPTAVATLPKLQQRVASVKERVLELARRQNALADLWLADPFRKAVAAERPRLAIERTVRLVRDQLSQREVLVVEAMTESFDPAPLPMNPVGFELTIAAALLCCGAGPAAKGVMTLTPEFDAASGHLNMKIDRKMAFGDIAIELGFDDAAGAGAAFTALTGLRVEVQLSSAQLTRIEIGR